MRWFTVGCVVCAAAVLVGRAQAQAEVRIGAGGPNGMVLSLPPIPIAGDGRMLLRRQDVQNHLRLTIRQRAELDEASKKPEMFRVAVQASSGDGADPSSLRKQAEEQIAAQLGSRDQKLKELLKPDQYDRLQELALHWRGPLAMADHSVAQKLALSQETRSAIGAQAEHYQKEKNAVMLSMMQQATDESADGTHRAVMIKMDTDKLENPLTAEYQTLDKAKKRAEAAIMSALTVDEKARWSAACGPAFTFRKDLKGLRF